LLPDLATILLFQNTCKGGQGPKRGLGTIGGGGGEEEEEGAVSHIPVLCTERISRVTKFQGGDSRCRVNLEQNL